MEASAKASSQRPAQHELYLIGSSQHPASPGLLNENKRGRGGGSGPVPMAPCSPPHKREATKTFSTMAGVGVRFHPECTGRRKAGRAGLHRQHRHVGAGEWQGPLGEVRRQARLRPKELSGHEVLVNRYPSPKAVFSVCMGTVARGTPKC